MKRVIPIFALLLAACSENVHNPEAVRQGVISHLANNTGISLSAMDVQVTAVDFRENTAEATVSFLPKGVTDPNAGMQMNYTLELQGNEWVVTDRAQGGTSGGAQGGATALPQGHPPMSGTPQTMGGSTGSDSTGMGGDASQIPQGHPDIGEGQ